MKKKTSLIIPANSDSFYVEDILINILLWSLKPSEIIIVITSNQKILIDKNLKKNLKKNFIDLIIVYKKNLFPGAARNAGILKAKYEFLVFLDMNTLPYKKDWLKINFNYLLKNNLDGIYGQTFYMANNSKEKIIRASTYGVALLNTIPGSIFKKKTVLAVGFFDFITRAGEDTEWLKRIGSSKSNIKNALEPVYYKGLYNANYTMIVKKWFRNYYYSSTLPHMLFQKNFYFIVLFFTFFFLAYNLNLLILQWRAPDELYFPHVTKIFLLMSFVFYTFGRGIYLPLKKKISIKYLFPYKFFFITLISLLLDFAKMLAFFLASLSRMLSKNIYRKQK